MSASREALLSTEVSARDAHGGEARIRRALPGPQDARGVRLQLPAQRQEDGDRAPRPARLPARARTSSCSGPPGTGKTHLAIALSIRACLAGHRVALRDRDGMGRPARRGQARRPPGGRARRAAADPVAGRRRGRLHPVRPAGREPDVRARLRRYERASMIVTSNKPFSALGRDLRRRHRRRRDDRPARPPCRDPQPQGRLLPPQRPRPRTPHQGRLNRTIRTGGPSPGPATPARHPLKIKTQGGHFSTGANGTLFDRP